MFKIRQRAAHHYGRIKELPGTCKFKFRILNISIEWYDLTPKIALLFLSNRSWFIGTKSSKELDKRRDRTSGNLAMSQTSSSNPCLELSNNWEKAAKFLCFFLFLPFFKLPAFLQNCFLCWDRGNSDVPPTLDAALQCSSRAGFVLGLLFCLFSPFLP